MCERKILDVRRNYSIEEKKQILSKTGGRCAHCGKKLTLDSMEKDHAIPFSKGGLSDISNIVPLCQNCNKNKVNYVVDPEDYFKFLKKPAMRTLKSEFESYTKGVDFYNLNTLFPTDIISFDQPVKFYSASGRKLIKKRVSFKKAMYIDLDEIYWFLKNYFSVYKCSYPDYTDPDNLKELITEWFQMGTILTLKDKMGNLEEVVVFYHMPCALNEEGDIVPGKVVHNIRTYVYIFFHPEMTVGKSGLILTGTNIVWLQSLYFGATHQLLQRYLRILGWSGSKPITSLFVGCGVGDTQIEFMLRYKYSTDPLGMPEDFSTFPKGFKFFLPIYDNYAKTTDVSLKGLLQGDQDFCRLLLTRLVDTKKYSFFLKRSSCPIGKILFISEISDLELDTLVSLFMSEEK